MDLITLFLVSGCDFGVSLAGFGVSITGFFDFGPIFSNESVPFLLAGVLLDDLVLNYIKYNNKKER